MRLEVLCTGDELLTGLTADTNSPFFMERVLRLGERVSRATVVGDDREAISLALREIAARCDAVLVSGGLGPTSDDLTALAAADAALVPVEFLRPPWVKVPQGAEVVENEVGAAPMFILQLGGCRAFFVPGVPREYRHLVEHEVLPRLEALRRGQPGALCYAFRLLRTVGLPESKLAALVSPLAAQHPQVEVGFRIQAPENHLKLLARGATQALAEAALAGAERAYGLVLGEFLYGKDGQTLAEVLLQMLRHRGHTVAFAESCTGGMLSQVFTAAPGASGVFPGALVAYSEQLKTSWADVPAELIAQAGVVSAEVAERLAQGVRARAEVTYGVGVTGYAGPGGGDEREPLGAVYVAVAGPSGTTCARHLYQPDRERVRTFAAWAALEALRRRLLEEEGQQ